MFSISSALFKTINNVLNFISLFKTRAVQELQTLAKRLFPPCSLYKLEEQLHFTPAQSFGPQFSERLNIDHKGKEAKKLQGFDRNMLSSLTTEALSTLACAVKNTQRFLDLPVGHDEKCRQHLTLTCLAWEACSEKSLIRAAAVFFPRANSFKAVKDAVIRLGHQNRSSWGLEIRSRDEHSATWARSKTLKFPLKLNEETVIAVKGKQSNHWESPKAFKAPPGMMLAGKQGSMYWITESDNRAQLLQGKQLR